MSPAEKAEKKKADEEAEADAKAKEETPEEKEAEEKQVEKKAEAKQEKKEAEAAPAGDIPPELAGAAIQIAMEQYGVKADYSGMLM